VVASYRLKEVIAIIKSLAIAVVAVTNQEGSIVRRLQAIVVVELKQQVAIRATHLHPQNQSQRGS
jgi:D-arabinose 5-phosphate isomerase GutQ